MSIYFPSNEIIEIKNIPYNTKILNICHKFNQELKKYDLPLNLEELLFDYSSDFNTEIKENILPENLRILRMSYFFNMEIKEKVLPRNLEELYLGFSYNHELKENVLPEKLKKIEFGNNYNKIINENVLPKSLEVIKFNYNYDKPIKEHVLPNSLKTIYFWPSMQLSHIPENVETLYILCDDSEKNNKDILCLPYNIKKVIINKKYKDRIKKIPFCCEIIHYTKILL